MLSSTNIPTAIPTGNQHFINNNNNNINNIIQALQAATFHGVINGQPIYHEVDADNNDLSSLGYSLHGSQHEISISQQDIEDSSSVSTEELEPEEHIAVQPHPINAGNEVNSQDLQQNIP